MHTCTRLEMCMKACLACGTIESSCVFDHKVHKHCLTIVKQGNIRIQLRTALSIEYRIFCCFIRLMFETWKSVPHKLCIRYVKGGLIFRQEKFSNDIIACESKYSDNNLFFVGYI